jgi:hypothetical protein
MMTVHEPTNRMASDNGKTVGSFVENPEQVCITVAF